MKAFFKTCGAIFLVSGTCIGAGMLALPIVTAKCGFGWSIVLFIGCWVVMLLSSLLVLEVNSALPEEASFSSMAETTLGGWGKVVTWLMFLLLLYALMAAYDTAGSAVLSSLFVQLHWPVSMSTSTWLFTAVFGGVVFVGTRLTDYTNRILLMIKLALFMFASLLMAPQVHWGNFHSHWQQYPFAFSAIPVVLTAFGSHFIIPTIRRYIGPEPARLRLIIVVGMLIPLVVYLLWQIVTIGVVPQAGPQSFTVIAKAPSAVKALVLVLVSLFQSDWVKGAIDGFMSIAVTTSFLGIALSLFDFFMDGLGLLRSRWDHRIWVASCTFIIPLLFAIFLPGGFILALRYAAIFAAVLVLILPALMSMRVRKSIQLTPFYQQSGGQPLRLAILLAGIGVIAVFILTNLSLVR